MEDNKKTEVLKNIAKQVWREQNLKFINILRGGGSDANQIAIHDVGILDGLGPVGGGAHTEKEWIYKDSIKQSIVLTTEMIIKLLA